MNKLLSAFAIFLATSCFASEFMGVEMKIDFHNPEPGAVYRIKLAPAGEIASFTGSTKDAPSGLKIDRETIEYKVPAGAKSVHFSVGAIVNRDSVLSTEIKEPASVGISISENYLRFNETFQKSQSVPIGNLVTAAPANCLAAPRCAATGHCPTGGKPELKCYGPLDGEFYCCSKKPQP